MLLQYYETKTKIKTETVKYLVLFDQKDQNKSWPNFNTASNVSKLPGLIFSLLIFDAILIKLQITTAQTLNCCYLQFEKSCSYIGGGDTSPLKSVATLSTLLVYQVSFMSVGNTFSLYSTIKLVGPICPASAAN